MKKTILTLAIAALACGAVQAQSAKDDIIKLSKAGCGDDLILSFVKSKGGATNFSTDDITEMKAAGVRDSLLTALVSGAAAPAPAPAPAPAQPVYIPPPQTTVVYEYPPPVYYRPYYGCCSPYYYEPYYSYPRLSFGYAHFSRHSAWGIFSGW